MPQPTTPFATSTPFRQSLFYALYFAGTGASLPFMPVWLKDHGMTSAEIGAVLAVPLLLRAVTGPWVGLWADTFARFRTPMAWLTAAGAGVYALMFLGGYAGGLRFPVYLVLFTLGFSCVSTVSPLIDAMTMALARREGFAYAIPRAVGSASFICANVGLGFVLLAAPSDAILLWMIAAAACSALGAALILVPRPRHETPVVAAQHDGGLGRVLVLLRRPGFLLLVIAVGCLQASHGFYYAFSTIIWKAQGLSPAVCGYLWAVAVTGEVLYMSLGEGLRRKVGPWRMLVVAAALGALRWLALMLSPPLWLLWPVQLLHLFSFAAIYMAGLELIYRLVPKGYEGLAQTVNAAYTAGVMLGLATLSSGAIYAALGVYGYGVSAGLALCGLAAAVVLFLGRERWRAHDGRLAVEDGKGP